MQATLFDEDPVMPCGRFRGKPLGRVCVKVLLKERDRLTDACHRFHRSDPESLRIIETELCRRGF